MIGLASLSQRARLVLDNRLVVHAVAFAALAFFALGVWQRAARVLTATQRSNAAPEIACRAGVVQRTFRS